jgi:hypothetical protein
MKCIIIYELDNKFLFLIINLKVKEYHSSFDKYQSWNFLDKNIRTIYYSLLQLNIVIYQCFETLFWNKSC